jgi:hypothetical protein
MKTRVLAPLIAGLALLCACKGKSVSGYEAVNNSSADADTTKTDTVTTLQPKLVKTAAIHFRVKSTAQTAESITALTKAFKGKVTHNRINSTAERSLDIHISHDSVMRVTSFHTIAEVTVKIPSSKLDDFMEQVARLGIFVDERSMDVTDKSLDYLSAQLKLKSRAELVSQQKRGKIVIKKPEDVLQLKDDMTEEQINNLEINDAVNSSIINLSFYDSSVVSKEIIANDDPAAYNLPFFKRLMMAFENGWGIFVELIIGLTNMWVFILAAACAWPLIKHYKPKKLAAKNV